MVTLLQSIQSMIPWRHGASTTAQVPFLSTLPKEIFLNIVDLLNTKDALCAIMSCKKLLEYRVEYLRRHPHLVNAFFTNNEFLKRYFPGISQEFIIPFGKKSLFTQLREKVIKLTSVFFYNRYCQNRGYVDFLGQQSLSLPVQAKRIVNDITSLTFKKESGITKDGLQRIISSFTGLKKLCFIECGEITDEVVQHFPTTLKTLEIRKCCNISRGVERTLPSFTSLESLFLDEWRSVPLTEDFMLPKTLNRLTLDCAEISPVYLHNALRLLTSLRQLRLIKYSSDFRELLPSLPQTLKALSFFQCTIHFSSHNFHSMHPFLRSLEEFESYSSTFSEEVFSFLPESLKSLSLFPMECLSSRIQRFIVLENFICVLKSTRSPELIFKDLPHTVRKLHIGARNLSLEVLQKALPSFTSLVELGIVSSDKKMCSEALKPYCAPSVKVVSFQSMS